MQTLAARGACKAAAVALTAPNTRSHTAAAALAELPFPRRTVAAVCRLAAAATAASLGILSAAAVPCGVHGYGAAGHRILATAAGAAAGAAAVGS